MDVYEVRNTEQADKDLENIATYIAQDNIQTALSYISKLQSDTQRILSTFPHKHREYKDCHVLPYGSYLVLFDIDQKQKIVNVLGIVNAAQYLRYKDFMFD